ncbi:hypothetical protein T261_03618 [Streptomyces lydicus]|nr:hypothetical protein T261_03618 [Streptomyces lydicus]
MSPAPVINTVLMPGSQAPGPLTCSGIAGKQDRLRTGSGQTPHPLRIWSASGPHLVRIWSASGPHLVHSLSHG